MAQWAKCRISCRMTKGITSRQLWGGGPLHSFFAFLVCWWLKFARRYSLTGAEKIEQIHRGQVRSLLHNAVKVFSVFFQSLSGACFASAVTSTMNKIFNTWGAKNPALNTCLGSARTPQSASGRIVCLRQQMYTCCCLYIKEKKKRKCPAHW